jgi:spermidine synthase
VNRRPSPLLLVLFLISGGCGLIYEVVWTRLFTVIIGNTVFSVSAILTVFMAGLALGSRLAGRLLDQKPIPLARTYAVLEAGIGIYNLLLPFFLRAADPLFGSLYSSAYQSFLILGLARLVISFALLIVPAALMGATLPVLIRLYVENIASVGTQVGRVYAMNTLGAALGAAAAGFLLVPYLGVTFALYSAAMLNLGIAVVAWRTGGGHETRSIVQQTGDVTPGPRILLVAMFLSGTAALMNEVAWTRVLGLVVGPTTYAFTLMLCAMITGLALGAAIGSRVTRRYEVRPGTFAWIEVGVGFASLAVVPAFAQLPVWIGSLVKRYAASFAAIQILDLFLFFGLLLVPTMLLGMTFPVASKLYAKSDSLLGSEVSAIYAFNTIGGIFGSLAAGFILIPEIGSQKTLMAAAVLSAATGVLVTLGTRAKAHDCIADEDGSPILGKHGSPNVVAGFSPRSSRHWLPAVCALILIPAILFVPTWDPELMASGAYKYAPYYPTNADLETMLTSGDLLYFKEGATTTVSTKKDRGKVSLAIDGKVDATDAGDMVTQKLLAHIPLLVSKPARNVAIIGLGSGVTAGAALQHPIEKLDVVEISPEVVEASKFFAHVNHNALGDPRTELIVGDGRNHLRYANRQYDVVISEPSNPWMSGMASLFTREFFREARLRLAPGGIHCQWFHGYNMSTDDVRTVIATFRAEFPHVTLWTLNEYDFLLLGSTSPLVIDERMAQHNFERVAADLQEVRIQDLYSITSLLFLRDDELDQFAEGAALNTDDHPVLEFRAPRFIHANTSDENFAALSRARRNPESDSATSENHRHKGEMFLAAEAFKEAMQEFQAAIALDIGDARAWKGLVETARGVDRSKLQKFFEDMLRTRPLPVVWFAAADFYSQGGKYAQAVDLLDNVLKEDPKNLSALEKLADSLGLEGSARLPEVTERLLAIDPENPAGLYHLATIRLYQNRLDETIQTAKRLLEHDAQHVRGRNLLAIAYGQTFQPELAEAEFRRAIEQSPEDWVSYNNYGLFLLERNRPSEALEQFLRAISMNPENVQGLVGMGEAHRQAGNTREAQAWYRKALRLDPNQAVAKQYVR